MSATHPAQLELERWHTGEAVAIEVEQHVAACAQCRSFVHALERARAELLAAQPAHVFVTRLRTARRPTLVLPPGALAWAAGVALVLMPALLRAPVVPRTLPPSAAELVAKGRTGLTVIRKRGAQQLALRERSRSRGRRAASAILDAASWRAARGHPAR